MSNNKIHNIKSISEFHRFRGLPKPEHPLISLIDYSDVRHSAGNNQINWVQNFYTVALKRNVSAKFRYGQQEYDFDEGLMSFIGPGQVFSVEVDSNPASKPTGWLLLIHPDFLWNTPLVKNIKQYEFFGYSVHESLFLSQKEENIITDILKIIGQEYQSNIDTLSKKIVIAQIEVLLNYADRFYHRQFITRKISNHQILVKLEEVLTAYFNGEDLILNGLPTVQDVAGSLNVSPNYLSSLLKVLTGQSTQQHIHNKLIEKAKEKLSVTDLTVSEIAYTLGFEHPQSFSKFFKSKTAHSPLKFRRSFH